MNSGLSSPIVGSHGRGQDDKTPAGSVQTAVAPPAPTQAGPRTYSKGRPALWDAATYDQIRAWLAEGVSGRKIARRLDVHAATLIYRCNSAGVDLPGQHVIDPDKMAAASEVLQQHFQTEPEWRKTLALYAAARGDNPTRAAMNNHARRLVLFRPAYHINAEQQARGNATRSKKMRAWREGLAPRAQALIDGGATRVEAAQQISIGPKTILRMFREGLLVDPPKAPKPARVVAAKPPRQPKPIKPPAPRKLPATYVRAPAAPPKPRPTYESVEAWLAAGNAITHCPTAAVERTTATIPEEDTAALRALYAQREAARPTGRNGAALKAITRQRGKNEGWFNA